MNLLEFQKNADLSFRHTFNELYGLGLEEMERYPKRILSVTAKDIQKVSQKYIDMNAYVLSIIEP